MSNTFLPMWISNIFERYFPKCRKHLIFFKFNEDQEIRHTGDACKDIQSWTPKTKKDDSIYQLCENIVIL